MSARKTAILNLRIDPAVKNALREAARREHRSIANMIEVLAREHCRTAGIPVNDDSSATGDDPPQAPGAGRKRKDRHRGLGRPATRHRSG